jgi:iron complex transport system permease protein
MTKPIGECFPVTGPSEKFRLVFPYILLLSLLAAALGFSLLSGDVAASPGEVFSILLSGPHGGPGPVQNLASAVVWQVRLPRALTALATGAGLAGCGVLFQALLLNPLAEPYTLGVASGAAFGAAVAISFQLPFLTFWAFFGSLAALGVVMLLGGRGALREPTRMILAGVVVGSILSAAIALLKAIAGQMMAAIVLWIMGSFAGSDWNSTAWCLPSALLVLLVGIGVHRDLDIVSSGSPAMALGVDESRLRLGLLLASSLATAIFVSFSGVVGFVGLVVPHLVRIWVGPNHLRVLPLSFLGGGLLMLVADQAARGLAELPVGVITALVGGPVFCLLLWRRA